jgi:hypothetical protein
MFWISLVVLAGLAWRNVRLGRSDRAAARTLAIAVIASWSAWLATASHSAVPLVDIYGGPGVLAQPLLFGAAAWLAYLGLEPQVRRVWPHLLITSTRLLGGRWRDPLVGRAVLGGLLVGFILALPGSLAVNRLLDLPGGGPGRFWWGELVGYREFVGWNIGMFAYAVVETLVWLTILLVARLAVRRATAAWAVLAAVMIGYAYVASRAVRPEAVDPLVILAVVAAFTLLKTWVFWQHGALALAVASYTGIVESTPWTLDTSRWYAWQGGFSAAILIALALWGFRNVLGKQSVFPSGTLD